MEVGSLITLVVLSGCFAVHESSITDDEANGCDAFNEKYSLGDIIKDPGNQDCTIYVCKASGVETFRERCLWDGQCYEVGESVEDSNCTMHTCMKLTRNSQVVHKMGGAKQMCKAEGKCHPAFSQYFIQGCKRYECDLFMFGFLMPKFIDRYCQAGAECKPPRSEYFLDGCQRYRCTKFSDTNLTSVFLGPYCRLENKCHPLGTEKYFDVCERYVCTEQPDRTAKFVLKKENTCCVRGTLHQDGDTFNFPGDSDCVKYSCSKGDYTVVKEACELGGTCIPVGFSVDRECKTITCTKVEVGPYYGYQLLETRSACEHNNSCIPEGLSLESECKFLTCTKIPVGSEFDYQLLETRTDCRFNGECRAVGSSYYLDGCDRFVCTKLPDGTAKFLLQKEKTCCVRGTLFQDGAIFTFPGDTHCTEYICSNGDYTVIKEACELNGTCIPLGLSYEKECKTITCIQGEMGPYYGYRFVVTRTACGHNKMCIPLGLSLVQECRTLTCTNRPGGNVFDVQLTETRTRGCEE